MILETEKRQVLRCVQDNISAGKYEAALIALRSLASPGDAYAFQERYAGLARRLREGLPRLQILKIAFLAGSTLNHFVNVLRFWLLLEGIDLEVYIAPYNSWRQEALDPSLMLRAFAPDIVWFFLTRRDISFSVAYGADTDIARQAVEDAAGSVAKLLQGLRSEIPALQMVNNLEADSIPLFGNYESSVSWSSTSLKRAYNGVLPKMLPLGTVIFDLERLSACYGVERWSDERLWCHSKHPFAMDAIGAVAHAAARLISASKGHFRKCVVLDLDNTLWGGVVADDGVEGIRIGPDGGAVGEAYAEFQKYLKALSEAGIALAICSKNDESVVREVFQRRTEMPLSCDDFVAIRANWKNKADNIRSIATELNLGLSTFVFIDDNPAERDLIRREIPEVAVPEMPSDPAEYPAALASGRWFERLQFSSEDRMRTDAYRKNAQRKAALEVATDLQGYLRDLQMRARWARVDEASLPRLVQLVNKTNQFNLTTIRYSHAELQTLMRDPNVWMGCFSLRDRFGDHGMISGVMLRFSGETAYIDTWVMSCRVFSRGMEDYVFATISRLAREHGCGWLEGRYVPTDRNGIVSDLYAKLGGICADQDSGLWRFDLSSFDTKLPELIRCEVANSIGHEERSNV